MIDDDEPLLCLVDEEEDLVHLTENRRTSVVSIEMERLVEWDRAMTTMGCHGFSNGRGEMTQTRRC